MLQLFNGNILLARSSAVDGYIYIYQQQRYARVGAGIIESGYVTDRGYYEKYGNGWMLQFVRAGTLLTTDSYDSYSGYHAYKAYTFPVPFYSVPHVIGFVELYYGAQCSCGPYTTSVAGTTLYVAGLDATNQAYPGYWAFGRWKA